LYLFDIMHDKITGSFRFDDIVMISSPAWSFDNTAIAFTGLSKAGHNDIYILDIENRELQQITEGFYEDRDPAWSPDNRSIVYSSSGMPDGAAGAYNLFLYDLDDGSTYQLTNGNHIDSTPVWSYDGNYIAFTSDRTGTNNIYLLGMNDQPEELLETGMLRNTVNDLAADKRNMPKVNLSGMSYMPGTVKEITRFTTGAFSPEWTPDGDIFFTAFEKYGYQLRRIRNADAVFDKDRTASYTSFRPAPPPWRAEKIESKTEVNTQPYSEKYSLDIAQGQVSTSPVWGTGGGAQFAVSDLLGNDNYYLLIYNNAQTRENFFRSFNFSFARYSLKNRTNLGYGLFHFAGRRYNNAEFFFSERYYGGFFNIRYPLSVFNRLEFYTSFGRSEKEWITSEMDRIAMLSTNYISYVHDNSLWGPTGPLDGSRYLVSLGMTKDLRHNNVNYYTFMVDLRKYYRLSVRTALAFRAMTMINNGKEAQCFFIGGSWNLRGYPRWQVWGQEINFFSTEYRFPFVDALGVRFPFGGIGFNAIRGALFFDAARIDDENYVDAMYHGSVGFGFRLNFGGALVFRYDIGRRIEQDFTRLSKKPFTQFFFGWDF